MSFNTYASLMLYDQLSLVVGGEDAYLVTSKISGALPHSTDSAFPLAELKSIFRSLKVDAPQIKLNRCVLKVSLMLGEIRDTRPLSRLQPSFTDQIFMVKSASEWFFAFLQLAKRQDVEIDLELRRFMAEGVSDRDYSFGVGINTEFEDFYLGRKNRMPILINLGEIREELDDLWHLCADELGPVESDKIQSQAAKMAQNKVMEFDSSLFL